MPGSVTGALNGDSFTVAGATTATSTTPVGTYPITYTVTGSNLANYSVTQATGILTISQATPSITWGTASSGTYGTALSATQLNATASVPGTFVYSPAPGSVLPAGTQTLSVTFSPTDTADYNTQTSRIQLSINKAPLTIAANSFARIYGATNPTFTGTISGAVNGDVLTESFSTTATPASIVGSYPIVPSVTGANISNYNLSAANGALTVSQAGTATTFTMSNSNLTLTASVASLSSGTPTGTVSFYEGQTVVGTVILNNGTASYTTPTFPSGDVVVTAQYSGDASFTQSASPPILVLTVQPAQTQLTAAPAGTVSDVFSLTSAPGFSGTIQFSCSGLPQYATCSFSPASITFGSSTTASTTLTIQTGTSASITNPRIFSHRNITALASLLFVPGLCLVSLGRRRRMPQLLTVLGFALLAGVACTSLTACGGASTGSSGGGSATRTPAGSSTVVVTAAGASGVQQTTNLTLTVQ